MDIFSIVKNALNHLFVEGKFPFLLGRHSHDPTPTFLTKRKILCFSTLVKWSLVASNDTLGNLV